MIIFTPIFESKDRKILPIPQYDGVRMSLEEYHNFSFEDPGYKYEWNNNVLESEERMKPREAIFFRNLRNKLIDYKLSENFEILSEMICSLESQKKVRIPDIGIYHFDNIKNYSKGESFFPILAIEVISPSNQAEELELKINEYFHEGVGCVWCIFPKLRQVKVYKSLKEITTCYKDDLCISKISNETFSISVNELFFNYD
jgi:Uma2 family endonuclease